MKRMVCEICEGMDFSKTDGQFVCQSCGMRYDAAEAKNLLKEVDGEVSTPAAPVVDNKKLDNLLELATRAKNASNNAEAENYANRALEEDSRCALAWMIKAEAVAWQSTVPSPRIEEALSCWATALDCTQDSETAKEYREIIVSQFTSVMKALLNLATKYFGELPNSENLADCQSMVALTIRSCTTLLNSFVVVNPFNEILPHAASKFNDAAVAGSDVADNDYGPDYSDKYKAAYDRWIQQSDNCLALLQNAMPYAGTESLANKICKNYEIIQTNLINSCSYKLDVYSSRYVTDFTLTDSAKQARRNAIASFKRSLNEKITSLKKEEEEKRRKAEEERQKKIAEYWETHADEKAVLEAESEGLVKKKAELEAEYAELAKKINANEAQINAIAKKYDVPVPADLELKDLDAQIRQLRNKRDSLGLFKGKEKKEIDAQIIQLDAGRAPLLSKANEQRTQQAQTRDDESAPFVKENKEIYTRRTAIAREIDACEKRIKDIAAYIQNPIK